ncbi:PucR-like helix-turn-helix protein [Streptomyces sp. SLBN-118]|uniref:PucR family transcriptional regulator n=1 Tax=Streptomyces sp. SLBN-118 TaxID=2768454 RepID=UPI00114EB874|nr:helix-turn-helix domain-containing protein [Streptomyces sp. SLBN-118]TQK51724.1 PucR-like helix-turn-helix protein [Streptomyces sp. SLBN-118]
MTTVATPGDSPNPAASLPRDFAAIMRPELPGLIREVIDEIRRSYPEYAEVLDGPYSRAVHLVVEHILTNFVDQVATPGASTVQRDKLCRRFGRFEAYEGRSLDTMQAVFRLGARLALYKVKRNLRRLNLPAGLTLAFADALLVYVDDLIEVSREGYLEARAEMEQGQDIQRHRLLERLLSDEATPRSTLVELAERAKWPLPDEVTLIAFSPDGKPDRGAIAEDVLVDLSSPQPQGLIPGPVDEHRRALMDAAPGTIRAAVGLTVPLADAAESLHWARRALSLVEAGILPNMPYTHCEDHLVALSLFADPRLITALAKQQLAPLTELTANQRERIIETLRAWLETRGNAVQMAELLHLHPQTVRYRLRNLEKTFGNRLTSPDDRFAIELVLRTLELRSRSGRMAGPSAVTG